VPFAVESYGGVGPAARKLLTQLAGSRGERTALAWLADACVRLSVALQRGNALILQAGMQQLRVEQLDQRAGSDCPLDSVRLSQRASRRRRARTFQRCHDEPACQFAAAFHASWRAGGRSSAAVRRFEHGRVELEAFAA